MTNQVPRPEGFDEFCRLANRLYDPWDLDHCTGGPLHVELDDHNTDHLMGPAAARTRGSLDEALEIRYNDRDIPDTADRQVRFFAERGRDEFSTDTLLVARRILEITQYWTEEQADAAYAAWKGADACDCSVYPTFIEEADDVR